MTILCVFMDDRVAAMITSMENVEESRLFVLFLFCLHFIPDIVSSQRIVFINKTTKWRDAHENCKSLNGSLASAEDLLSVTIPQCAKDMETVWTGNISVVTPMLSLKACVNASEEENSKQRSQTVEQCAALCSASKGFEIQKHRCNCLDDDIPLSEVNATHCEYKCKHDPEEQFCGGENVSNIYTFLDPDKIQIPVSVALNESNCAFTSCQNTNLDDVFALSVDKCVKQTFNNSIILCSRDSTSSYIGNVTNWQDACQSCISRYGRYPIDLFNKELCCNNDVCKTCGNERKPSICFSTWTSTRQYKGRIIAYDMEMDDFNIIECTYARFSSDTSSGISFHSSAHQICKVDNNRNIACKIHSTNIGNFPCRAPSSINPPSLSTSSAITSVTQAYLSISTKEYISTLATRRQDNNEENSSSGIIVGIVIGIVVSVAAVIIAIILRRRISCTNNQAKAQDKNSTYQISERDLNNDVIYQATSDGDYDHLNVKRKHATETKIETDVYNHVINTHGKENVENNYDQMSNLKDQNMTENTYYSHAKTQNSASQGETSNEYDVTGPLQILANRTINVENAYDVCSKSGISQS